jgi:hypothetical protein
MNVPLAYCGLECSGCPILLATVEADPEKKKAMREEVIRVCRERYGIAYAMGDISDCDGCRGPAAGRLFSGCAKCGIRQCARDADLQSCAFCGEYPCGKLKEIFQSDPAAGSRLDELHRTFA